MEILAVNVPNVTYTTYALHSHGYWEILLNLSGSGTAHIGGKDYSFREGTIFCIPPNMYHQKVSETGYSDACVFTRDFLPLYKDRLNCFEDDSSGTFRNLIMTAYAIQMKNEANARAVVNAIGNVLYQLLISWSSRPGRRNASVEEFQDLLLKNISNSDFDLASELKKTGYSGSYFRRRFRESAGCSPLQYFLQLRMEYAKKQFEQYHEIYTVKEIAAGCGFTDPYYFSRIFKKFTGQSPQNYVRNLGVYNVKALYQDEL